MLAAPLLRRTQPYRHETLPSFLYRLALLNFYDPPNILHRFIKQQLKAAGINCENLNMPTHWQTFQCLQSLTQLPIADLYHMSGHWLATFTNPPDKSLAYITLPPTQTPLPLMLLSGLREHHIYRYQNIQFCALCLQEKRFHSCVWNLRFSAVCLRHHCLLLNAASLQRSVLPLTDIFTLDPAALNAAAQQVIRISPNDPGSFAQQLLLAWLGLAAAPLAHPHFNSLPPAAPHILYSLFYGLANCLIRWPLPDDPNFPLQLPPAQSSKGYLATLSSLDYYHILTTTVHCLLNWPDNFQCFLQTYHAQHVNHQRPFGTFMNYYLNQYWQHPDFHFIHQAFNRYYFQHFRYVPYRKNVQPQPDQAPLAPPAARVPTYTQDQICQRLALNPTIVQELVSRQLIQAAPLPPGPWHLEQTQIDTLLDRLDHACPFIPSAASLLTLRAAALKTSCIGYSQAQLLALVLSGRLPAFKRQQPLVNCSNLRFDPHAVQQLIATVRQQNGWLTRNDLAQHLHVDLALISRWVQLGFLQPSCQVKKFLYFNAATLQIFEQTYMRVPELAARCQLTVKQLKPLLRAGHFPICSGPSIDGVRVYLFERATIEAFLHDHPLTFTAPFPVPAAPNRLLSP